MQIDRLNACTGLHSPPPFPFQSFSIPCPTSFLACHQRTPPMATGAVAQLRALGSQIGLEAAACQSLESSVNRLEAQLRQQQATPTTV